MEDSQCLLNPAQITSPCGSKAAETLRHPSLSVCASQISEGCSAAHLHRSENIMQFKAAFAFFLSLVTVIHDQNTSLGIVARAFDAANVSLRLHFCTFVESFQLSGRFTATFSCLLIGKHCLSLIESFHLLSLQGLMNWLRCACCETLNDLPQGLLAPVRITSPCRSKMAELLRDSDPSVCVL